MNPFLEKSDFAFEAFDFRHLKPEHFLPALEIRIAETKKRIEIIKEESHPTFENTIIALEQSFEYTRTISKIFEYYLGANTNKDLQDIAEDVSSQVINFYNDIILDQKLFSNIKKVYDKTPKNLSLEEAQLLKKTYKEFVRNGALLSDEQKEELRTIDEEISKYSIRFGENLLKATNAFELYIDDHHEIDGLPDAVKEQAQEMAAAKGRKGKWLFTLHYPSYVPVITYAKNRALREKMFKAYGSRCVSGEFSNEENIKALVSLRLRRAKLFGKKSHAEYVLEERMAQNPDTVDKFSQKIIDLALGKAKSELEEIKTLQKELSPGEEFKPWDQAFYAEILKKKKLDLDEEKLRPYFKIENVIEGAFTVARKLYNINFNERTDIPVHHPEAKVYEVIDVEKNEVIALFYTDFFPRETKQGGAWMTDFREHSVNAGLKKIPHVVITCNFTKPTASKPSLISLDEVKTLFHEFGHALHGILSLCHFNSLSGTNVYWDFVELPSQIMENWVVQKECLDLFAKHYQTGELIPAEWIKKIQDAEKFLTGLYNLRQMQLGALDMFWHNLETMTEEDVITFENKVLAPYRLVEPLPGLSVSSQFSHIFDGGYSSGYYSYKWAEVLDADAFAYFQEKGIFNQTVANSFRRNILEKGGSEHPMELYKKFRGSEPRIESLLERSGLI